MKSILQNQIKLIALISFLVGNILACVQGSGNLATRDLSLVGVNKVTVSGIGLLSVIQDSSEKLVIEADDNVMPYIISEVVNDEIKIRIKNNTQIIPSTPLIYRINIKDVSQITASGSVEIETQEVKTNALIIDLSGSTNMTAKIAVKDLQTKASGSNKIVLSGNADAQDIKVSGSATFDGTSLSGKNALIDASGSVNIIVNVSDKIEGKISGAGSIQYLNNPSLANLKASGAFSISKK